MKIITLLLLSTIIFSAETKSVGELFAMTDDLSFAWTADAKNADKLNDAKMKEAAKEKFVLRLYNEAFPYLPAYMKYIKHPHGAEVNLNDAVREYNKKYMILVALQENGAWNAKVSQVDRSFDECETQMKVVDTMRKQMGMPALALTCQPTLALHNKP